MTDSVKAQGAPRFLAILLPLLTAFTVQIRAQQDPALAPNSFGNVLQQSAQKVTVDVGVVLEKTHQFVPGLKISSFRLYEDDVEQKLSNFELVGAKYEFAYHSTNPQQEGTYRKLRVVLVDDAGKPLVMQDERQRPLKYEIQAPDGYWVKAEAPGSPVGGNSEVAPSIAEPARGFVPEPAAPSSPASATSISNGNYYALVIGIDHYRPPMPELKTAVADAQAIDKLLREKYGFQTKLLLDKDATRDNILDAITRYRNTLGENDSLLIYYAGHGYSDRDADKAYWLPVDADSIESSHRIIADDLTTGIKVQRARHVLIISDSCYSGGLSRDADTPIAGDGQQAFLARMAASRSRTLMASGGDEPVSDKGTDGHSVFAYAILKALDTEANPVFTASDLFFTKVRQQVAGRSEQLPQYSIIRNSNHDEGDFVFARRTAPTALVAANYSTPAPSTIDTPSSLTPTTAEPMPPPPVPSQTIAKYSVLDHFNLWSTRSTAYRQGTFDLVPNGIAYESPTEPGFQASCSEVKNLSYSPFKWGDAISVTVSGKHYVFNTADPAGLVSSKDLLALVAKHCGIAITK